MKKTILIIILVIGFSFAQTMGRINGLVTDAETNSPVIGANVWIYGTNIGIATDSDGKFIIDSINPGIYEIRVTYIGYTDKILSEINVRSGEITPLVIMLDSAPIQGNEVKVQATAKRDGEINRILEQRQTESIMSSFSAAEIRKSGDSNAGQVLKRITGVTVVDDKQVIIRGLGERYSSTLLNQVSVPSPDPDRKSIPLNLFSSALIEKINVFKSFTPDLPGAFAGGIVDIRTKSYPDGYTFNTKASLGNNSTLNVARYLRNDLSGSSEFFGFDNGVRALPGRIPTDQPLPRQSNFYFYQIPDDFHPELDILAYPDRPDNDPLNLFITTSEQVRRIKMYRSYLGDMARSFKTNYQFHKADPGIPLSIGVSGGNNWTINDDLEYGFYTLGSFSNNYEYTSNHRNMLTRVSEDSMAVDETLDISSSSYNTNLGLSASAGIKWREKIKVDFNSIYTHSSKDEIKYVIGTVYDLDNPAGLLMSHPYQEKSIRSTSLRTRVNDPIRISWFQHSSIEVLYSDSRSQLDEPDRKDHYYDLDFQNDGTIGDPIIGYNLMHTSYLAPGYRYFSGGWETANTTSMDYVLEGQVKLKFGFRSDLRERTFSKRIFTYDYYNESTPWSTAIPADWREITSEDSMMWFLNEDHFYSYNAEQDTSSHNGIILLENQDDINQNAYHASEKIYAGYAMATVPLIKKSVGDVIFGVRNEKYDLKLLPFNPVTGESAMITSVVPVDTTLMINNADIDTTLMLSRKVPLSSRLHTNDMLPSLSVMINTSGKSQLRLSISKTVVRPEFREIAPYPYVEFHGGQRSIGNIYLKTTSIRNYDMRWEWYPTASQMVSVGVFAKSFTNPIEVSLIKQTDDKYYQTWQNALSGWSRGIEFESVIKLPILPITKGLSTFNFNAIYTKSQAISDSNVVIYNNGRVETRNASASLKRPLQGQSDIVLNASLYFQYHTGWDFNIAFNTFSKRLAYLGAGQLEDEYEYPFHALDLVLGKRVGKNFRLALKGKNLLDSVHKFGMTDPGGNNRLLVTRNWKPGTTFSFDISYDLIK
ncbi:MAG: carboxypeptidase-like regulatory domain-containing protein [Candidatus Marinimicrobia bacterium]|nr:carboxypeptidase-like regulatory domain-containing protein [Candidatus Neomarinimicrobiota bacterium]